jgi:hypothetical protein
MKTPSTPALVTGLDDGDIKTSSRYASPPTRAAAAGSVSLSLDALAKLFAAQRSTLLDADMTTGATRVLLAEAVVSRRHDE